MKHGYDWGVALFFFRAVRRYTAAIRVDPTYIRAYICRAEAYHKLHMVSFYQMKSHVHNITMFLRMRSLLLGGNSGSILRHSTSAM